MQMLFFSRGLFFLLSLQLLFLVTLVQSRIYVVQLNRYAPLEEHEVIISDILFFQRNNFHHLPRSSLVSGTPTDFALIETNSADVLNILRISREFIRKVHLESRARVRRPFAALAPEHETSPSSHVAELRALHARGIDGNGVHVAIFDTGISPSTLTHANIVSQTDWTRPDGHIHDHEAAPDSVGHGTFITGLLGGSHPYCPGIAPGAHLHIYKLFTGAQISYTSWFLDAFNHALAARVHILNLSIGGPDFADEPFVDKVNELSAAGIVVVSAIGNDGPTWGTLNNPGDLMDVVGVGGVDLDESIASFSSRGMSTSELQREEVSYGRAKPDIVTFARALIAPSHTHPHKCRRLSGTSVASPVVAGAIALMVAAVPERRRSLVVNPASVKRALMTSAKLVKASSVYEQGAGLLRIGHAVQAMLDIDREFVQALEFADRIREQLPTDPVLRMLDPQSRDSYEGTAGSSPGRGHDSERHPFGNNANSSSWTVRSIEGENVKQNIVRGRLAHEQIPSSLNTLRVGPLPLENVEDKTFPNDRQNLDVESNVLQRAYTTGPSAYAFPEVLDMSAESCEYMWPHCSQPLFESASPITVNVTIFNLASVHGVIGEIVWHPGLNGRLLLVQVSAVRRFWPWTAGLGVHISVAMASTKSKLVAEGVLRIDVLSPSTLQRSVVDLPIRVSVVPKPPRSRRILWDMFHSLRYPPGYVPRDTLSDSRDLLDWLGDHPHTNFRDFFIALRAADLFVETIDTPLCCLPADIGKHFGTLIVIDPEDDFLSCESTFVHRMVSKGDMTLFVVAEWSGRPTTSAIRFADDNTRSEWTPIVGGANTHALNRLLRPFSIAFADAALSGQLDLHLGGQIQLESASAISKFPADGALANAHGLLQYGEPHSTRTSAPVLGFLQRGNGTVIAFTDTYCLEASAVNSGHACRAFFANLIVQSHSRMGSMLTFIDESAPKISAEFKNAAPPSKDTLRIFKPHSRTRKFLEEQLDLREACKKRWQGLRNVRVEDTELPWKDSLKERAKSETGDASLNWQPGKNGAETLRWQKRDQAWMHIFIGCFLITCALAIHVVSRTKLKMIVRRRLFHHIHTPHGRR